jgi:hypothetical protein
MIFSVAVKCFVAQHFRGMRGKAKHPCVTELKLAEFKRRVLREAPHSKDA